MLSVTPSGQRADDWIRTSMSRFTRAEPFSVEPRRPIQRGDRWELNPYLLLHRQACLPRTPRTPYCFERKERESNPQGRKAQPASNRVPSPIGLPFRFVQFFKSQ